MNQSVASWRKTIKSLVYTSLIFIISLLFRRIVVDQLVGSDFAFFPYYPAMITVTYFWGPVCGLFLMAMTMVAATDLPKIVPQANQAIRDGQYKLVRNFTKGFDAASDACVNQESEEFYLVNQNLPIPKLDRDGDDLLATVGLEGLTKPQQRIYHNLAKKLDSLLKNNILCKGDGNRDGVIDRKDLQEWETFSQTNGGGSSWYDFTGPENLGPDGRTDSYDQAYIQKYIGKPCSPEEQ